jgi:sigma-B regulation protein RsbU (phosphoserine phosphatase)
MMEQAANVRLVQPGEQSGQPLLSEARSWSAGLLEKPSVGDHICQFYEDDEFLFDAVAHFAAAGLAAGEPVLIVATEPHCSAFAERLRRNRANPEVAVASGQLVILDAHETLARFMVGNEPHRDRFCATMGPVLEKCRASRAAARVRVFGEMVDLLWRAGNRTAAVRLEEFWNELARLQSFTLMCAYSMGNFYMPGDGEVFDHVCRRHSHVIPPGDSAALVRSLETELEQRKQLEGVLRQALQKRASTAGEMEHKSAQEAERFHLLIESVKEYAIFMLDVHGRVSSWNPGAERIKGYRAEEIIGQHFSRFYPPEDVAKCDMELEVAAREGRFEDEGWRVRKDGTRFWANVVISRMVAHDGSVVGFAKVTRDLTSRRQLEEERVARAALEQKLAEQKKTQELRELLIGIVGHDLRAPLSTVATAAGLMLKRGTLAGADAKATARIARSADRMSKMISQLLDFTRARLGGGITIDPRPMDLADVCAEVIAEIETAHPDRTVLFDTDVDTRGLWDRERLAQVVSNLVGNAIQHGNAHSAIDVQLRNNGDRVTLRVHNEGPAIAHDLLPLVFDPFRRQPTHPAPRAEGLGLGLYICREMIRAHGGEVAVQSSDSAGTTFTVQLPRSASL